MTMRSIVVGMAEIHVIRSTAQFSCIGLGSCVAVCALDPLLNVGGMVHVMLPEAPQQGPGDKLGKFADTGIAELISRMVGLGAAKERITIALAGGAQVALFGAQSPGLCIGARNVEAVQKKLEEFGMKPVNTDTGGNAGRTVQFDIETGVVRVRTVNLGERELCKLRAA